MSSAMLQDFSADLKPDNVTVKEVIAVFELFIAELKDSIALTLSDNVTVICFSAILSHLFALVYVM